MARNTSPVRARAPERAEAPAHRRQRVVVRAIRGALRLPEVPEDEPRDHLPTLAGLGEAGTERGSEATVLAIDESAVSHVRARVAIFPPAPRGARRARPVTLYDGVDDDAARRYREEAERILASGLFDDPDT